MRLLKQPPSPFRLSLYTFGHFCFEYVANYLLIAVIDPHLTSNTQLIQVLIVCIICDYGLRLFTGETADPAQKKPLFCSI